MQLYGIEHNDRQRYIAGRRQCEHCPNDIPWQRPRRSIYCSNACKQAAYRKRIEADKRRRARLRTAKQKAR